MSNRFCDRQNPFEKFDDGQFIERFWLTMATTLALLNIEVIKNTTTPTEQRMRRRSKTRIN